MAHARDHLHSFPLCSRAWALDWIWGHVDITRVASAAAAVAAAVRSAFLSLSLGGEGHRRGVGGEQEADHREEVLLQLALLQTGLTRKSKRPPLEGKKEKRDKDGCKGET